MKKITLFFVALFLSNYVAVAQSKGEDINNNALNPAAMLDQLDVSEISTGVLYPFLENDSTALWFKFNGAKDTLLSFRVNALIIRTQNHHLLDTLRKNSATRSDSFFS